jgi:hypothetical protein
LFSPVDDAVLTTLFSIEGRKILKEIDLTYIIVIAKDYQDGVQR